MPEKRSTRLILTDEQFEEIELITETFADEISTMGAIPRVYKRDGSVGPNIQAAVALALTKLAAQARAKQSKSE